MSSSYETAPATRMLATQCAVCARPLLDAVSVETGIGPHCRAKYGFNVEVAPELRAEANRLVYQIACDQASESSLVACERLQALGFAALAKIIRTRLADVVIAVVDDAMHVKMAWNPKAKEWTMPPTHAAKSALMQMLRKHLPGRLAVGDKGPFVIPALA